MRQLTAFTKKELRESLRTGRMPLLVILSVLFGIMNPLVAKLTPWMMENFAGSLEESGMVLTEIKVDVFTSWTQFYKNTPIYLIVFIVIASGILTTEYQKGTLIIILTKGMNRWKPVSYTHLDVYKRQSCSFPQKCLQKDHKQDGGNTQNDLCEAHQQIVQPIRHKAADTAVYNGSHRGYSSRQYPDIQGYSSALPYHGVYIPPHGIRAEIMGTAGRQTDFCQVHVKRISCR